jgi:NADH-quinone oxidoreductase subunit A
MPSLLDQYLPLAVFMAVAAVISGALLVAPFLVAFKAPDPEKLSAYECGFNAFDDARMRFDVRFYLVSLLFIIFDLEVGRGLPRGRGFRLLVDDDLSRRSTNGERERSNGIRDPIAMRWPVRRKRCASVCHRAHGVPTSLILPSIAAFIIAMPARNCAACSSVSDRPMAIFAHLHATKATTSAKGQIVVRRKATDPHF